MKKIKSVLIYWLPAMGGASLIYWGIHHIFGVPCYWWQLKWIWNLPPEAITPRLISVALGLCWCVIWAIIICAKKGWIRKK